MLFVPAGVVLLAFAWAVGREHRLRAAVWMGLVALALIGVGAREALAGPWTVLAIPACAAGALAGGRACVRGSRDPWTAWFARSLQNRSRPARHPVRWARVYLGGLAVLCLVGVFMAASAA